MEYLLVITLSGSTMTIIYLLMRRFLWNKCSARLFYMLAKVAVLYYLIPLPFLKQWYKSAIWVLLQKGKMKAARIPLIMTSYAVHTQEKLYVNIYAEVQMVLVVVWLLGVSVRIGKLLPEYVKKTRRCAGYAEKLMTDRHREIIAEFKKEHRVKRPVALYRDLDGEPTMTFGVFKPVIICSKEPESREAELLLHHEMVHIRRQDVFWEMLLELAMLLHWWNPLMKKLYRDFGRVCECSCDETAMQGKSREEVKEYLRLMIEGSREHKETKSTSFKWKAGFGGNSKIIRERMDNLMRNKKWNRFAACALVAALTLANSMTVFAYRDTVHVEVTEDVLQDEMEKQLDSDIFGFDPVETDVAVSQEFEEVEILFDGQFTDEEGNIYPIVGDGSVEPHCNHDYVSGISSFHNSYSDGSCEVRKYDSQRCGKCGYVLLGALISTHNYVKCPH